MASYQELQAQLEALTQKTEAARVAELATVIEQVRETVAAWGLTEKDVFGRRTNGAARTSAGDRRMAPMPPKYRDPQTGATWNGRGRAPGWLDGKKRERFLIED